MFSFFTANYRGERSVKPQNAPAKTLTSKDDLEASHQAEGFSLRRNESMPKKMDSMMASTTGSLARVESSPIFVKPKSPQGSSERPMGLVRKMESSPALSEMARHSNSAYEESRVMQILPPAFEAKEVGFITESESNTTSVCNVTIKSFVLRLEEVQGTGQLQICAVINLFDVRVTAPSPHGQDFSVGIELRNNAAVHRSAAAFQAPVSAFALVFRSHTDAAVFASFAGRFSEAPPAGLAEYAPLTTVGKGKFGAVMVCKRGDYLVAVKESRVTPTFEKHAVDERAVSEVVPPSRFLVTTFAMLLRGRYIYNVMEFCPGGDLYSLVSDHFHAVAQNAAFYAAEVLLALEHLHAHDVLYRDLKPENIFVGRGGHLKLGDFGLAKWVDGGRRPGTTLCGTESYMCPEVLDGKERPYLFSCDFWQFACLVYELHVGNSPFYQRSGSKVLRRQAVRAARFQHAPTTPAAARALVDATLAPEVPARAYHDPRAGHWAALRAHAFFAGTDWAALRAGRAPAPLAPPTEGARALENFDPAFRRLPAAFSCHAEGEGGGGGGEAAAPPPEVAQRLFGFDYHEALAGRTAAAAAAAMRTGRDAAAAVGTGGGALAGGGAAAAGAAAGGARSPARKAGGFFEDLVVEDHYWGGEREGGGEAPMS